jgi:hypothetical protein
LDQIASNAMDKLSSNVESKLSELQSFADGVPDAIKKIHESQQFSNLDLFDEPSATELATQINCFECNSQKETDCLDTSKLNNFVRNCSSNSVGCWKIDQWVDYDGGSGNLIYNIFMNQ